MANARVSDALDGRQPQGLRRSSPRQKLNYKTRLQPGSWSDGSAGAAPAKDPGSVPKTHMEAPNHLLLPLGDPVPHCILHGYQHTLGARIYML